MINDGERMSNDVGVCHGILGMSANSESFDKAKMVAARFVDYQMRSRFEVKQRLFRAGFCAEVVQAVLALFAEQGLLDDVEFALVFIQDKLHVARYGKFRIVHGLRAKGVSAEDISIAFARIEVDPLAYINTETIEETEENNAVLLLSQKYRNAVFTPDVLKKAVAFLARRGYSREVIARSISIFKGL